MSPKMLNVLEAIFNRPVSLTLNWLSYSSLQAATSPTARRTEEPFAPEMTPKVIWSNDPSWFLTIFVVPKCWEKSPFEVLMIILVLYAWHFCCAHPIEGSNLCNVEVFVRVKEKNATGTAWHLGQEFRWIFLHFDSHAFLICRTGASRNGNIDRNLVTREIFLELQYIMHSSIPICSDSINLPKEGNILKTISGDFVSFFYCNILSSSKWGLVASNRIK